MHQCTEIGLSSLFISSWGDFLFLRVGLPINMADEYSNTSADVDERKRQRRKRIEKNGTSEQAQVEDHQENQIEISKTGQQQVEESLFELDTRKRAGIKTVTDIRIETNEGEAKRRLTDEELKRSRLIKLQQEALVSAKANAAVEMKWTELLEKEIPQVPKIQLSIFFIWIFE